MAEIPLQMRGVIIACSVLYNATWTEIEKMTGIKADTARHLINTLEERAGTCDLNELLAVAVPLPHTGCTVKVVDGTQESRALQQLVHDNPKRKFDELGIPLARSTIEYIMYIYNEIPISYKVEQFKPILDADNIE